jgi:hypothetical protein
MTAGLSSIVGDSSLQGWATFLVYLMAASVCVRNARRSGRPLMTGISDIALAQSRRRFWFVLAALLLLLGLTRQLDLDALSARAMRGLLGSDGVYEERIGLQIGLIATIGGFGTLGLLVALFTFRRAQASLLLALVGAAVLLAFTLIRAISLHDIDRLLAYELIPYVQVDNLIEIALLAVIAFAGFAFSSDLRDESETARLRTLSIQERRRLMAEKRRAGRS